uniref:Gag-pol polyprotein n=1 Tax=Solanum tuberosum TaxID=4113 RepID=M1DII3_SOLTU
MSVNEYALNFTRSSKYALSLVASPRDLMNRFMTGVSELVEEEFCMTMLVDDMDISHLMVFAQQIEESKLKKKRVREKKSTRVDNDGFDGPGHCGNRQRFSGQGYSNAHKYKDESVSSPRPQGKDSDPLYPTCSRCGKRHEGRCLAGRDGCYGCGDRGHMKKDCPKAKATIREGKQVAPSGGDGEPPKRNRFYALQSKDNQE